MKINRFLILAGLSALTMSNSCETTCGLEGPPCPDGPVEQIQIPGLADYSAYGFAGPVADVGQAKQYVINSAAEYEALFTRQPRPTIDFQAYTLLAGETKMTSGGSVASQAVASACPGPGYAFAVKLNPGVTQAIAEVAYFAVVPKLPADAKVTFDVQLLP